MIEFKKEFISEVRDEIEPMLEQHYLEVAMYQDHIKLNPDWQGYENMEDMDLMYIFTMRDDEKLVGYSVFFITPHLHYQDHEYAVNDIVYIDPEYRGTEHTPNFFMYCQDEMKDNGASVITYHMKVFKPFHTLMEILGYDHAEHLYMKYIGS